MNFYFRCLIAGVFALLTFASPLAWAVATARRIILRLQNQYRDQLIAEGKLEELSQLPTNGSLVDFGSELPAGDMTQIMIGDLLWKYWWLWAIVAIGLAYGLFVLLGYILPGADREAIKDSR